MFALLAIMVQMAVSTRDHALVKQHTFSTQLKKAMQRSPTASPVDNVVNMLTEMKQKLFDEQTEEQTAFNEEIKSCDAKYHVQKRFVENEQGEWTEVSATLQKADGEIDHYGLLIESTISEIAAKEQKIKEIQEERKTKLEAFKKKEASHKTILVAVESALKTLSSGKGTSALQIQRTKSIVDALATMVQASAIDSADSEVLTSMLQSAQASEAKNNEDEDSDESKSVPPVTKSTIVETLEGILDKAQGQLEELRDAETTSRQAFELEEQALQNEVKSKKDTLARLQQSRGAEAQVKAESSGDLAGLTKSVKADTEVMKLTEEECEEASRTFKDQSKERAAAMTALSKAKKAIEFYTKGPTDDSAGGASFLQVTSSSSVDKKAQLDFEVVQFVRDLGHKQNSASLVQLSFRMANAIRRSAAKGVDPFGRVKKLIDDMIKRLQNDGAAEADKEAYCRKEQETNEASFKTKEGVLAQLKTAIDTNKASMAEKASEIAEINQGIAERQATAADDTEKRQKAKLRYDKAKAVATQGEAAVQDALNILRDFYEKKKGSSLTSSTGGFETIIGLLEVVQADFQQTTVDLDSAESSAKGTYDEMMATVAAADKVAGVNLEHKNKEVADLQVAINDLIGTETSESSQLASIKEYLDKIKKDCVSSAGSFEDRKAKLTKEIAGLNEALTYLGGDSLVQKSSTHRTLRLRGGN